MKRQSKCDICRQRKVKCDEQRPRCGPCVTGGRPCTYNLKPDNTSAAGLRLARTRVAPDGSGVFQCFAVPSAVDTATPRQKKVTAWNKEIGGREVVDSLEDCSCERDSAAAWDAASEASTAVPGGEKLHLELQELSLSSRASQHQLLDVCLDVFEPRRRSEWLRLQTDLSRRPDWDWLPYAFSAAFEDPLLLDVVLGFSLAVLPLGSTEAGIALRRQLYRRAYQRLRVRMDNPKARLSNSVFATVKFLGYYEGETSIEGCEAHVRGASALALARGASNWETAMGASMCLSSRLSRVVVFWYDGTLVPRSQLRGTPSAHVSAETALIDTLSELPELVQRTTDWCNQVDKGLEVAPSSFPPLLQSLRELELELAVWQAVHHSVLSSWTEPSQYSLDPNTKGLPTAFPERLCFEDVPTATQSLLLMTAELSLCTAKLRLYRCNAALVKAITPEQTPDEDTHKKEEEAVRQQRMDVMRRILESFEYFFHPDMGAGGPEHIEVYPAFCVVKDFVKSESLPKEAQWVVDFTRTFIGTMPYVEEFEKIAAGM